MRRALDLARRGAGRVEPNPRVGAVLVRGNEIVGEGWHRAFGQPHAEAEALAAAEAAGHDPRGTTLYVTLEPCSHYGKTPPCCEAVAEAGVARVVVAMIDPDPRVQGRGLKHLRSANIAVDLGVLEDEARRLNAGFIKRVTRGLPWVTLKWAMTVDGRTATSAGHSQWISNPTSRQRVHERRAQVDAVMVGIGTVLADNPRLTARDTEPLRQARRVVLDPQLRTPPDAQLIQHPDPPVTLAVAEDLTDRPNDRYHSYINRGIEIIGLPPCDRHGPAHHLDLAPLLRHLADAHAATHVLVEGGAGLTGSLLQQQLADQLLVFIGPTLLADPDAPGAAYGLSPATIDQGTPLQLRHIERFDNDVMLEYDVLGESPSDP